MFILISERLSASKDVCIFSHILLPHFRKDFCIYIAARTLYSTVHRFTYRDGLWLQSFGRLIESSNIIVIKIDSELHKYKQNCM